MGGIIFVSFVNELCEAHGQSIGGHLMMWYLTYCSYQPVGFDQYEVIRSMAEEIRTTAPDARVLTSYYCGE